MLKGKLVCSDTACISSLLISSVLFNLNFVFTWPYNPFQVGRKPTESVKYSNDCISLTAKTFFSPVFLRNSWHTSLCKLRCTVCDGLIYRYCEMINTIGLVVHHLMQIQWEEKYLSWCDETLKVCHLSNFPAITQWVPCTITQWVLCTITQWVPCTIT